MSENNYNECPICLNNARLPIVTKCGHIFCWECIKGWVKTKGKLECPICKDGIKLEEVIKLYSGDNEVKKGEVDDRPQQERIKPEVIQPNIYNRVLNNLGLNDYSNNSNLRPPSQKEVQRNILSLVVLISGIAFIFYILK